jgi:hypothetical protein
MGSCVYLYVHVLENTLKVFVWYIHINSVLVHTDLQYIHVYTCINVYSHMYVLNMRMNKHRSSS